MRRRLSSRTTLFWALIFPLVWSTGFGIGTLALFLIHKLPPPPPGKAPMPLPVLRGLFLIGWLIGTAVNLWLIRNLKQVFRDDGALYVSSVVSGSEVAVPESEVARVRVISGFHVGGKHPVVVELRESQSFGKRIVFLPTGKPPRSWPWQRKPHPIVAELENLAARNEAISYSQRLR